MSKKGDDGRQLGHQYSPKLKNPIYRKIVEAALDVFSREGYKAASLDEIADVAGMTKGAIYWHFKNKLDLYSAVDDFVAAEVDNASLGSVEDPSDVVGRIVSLVKKTLEFYRTRPLIFDFTMKFMEGPFMFQSMMNQKLVRAYEKDRSTVAEIISKGIREGKVRKVDPDAFALMITGMMDGVLIQWSLDKSNIDLDKAGSEISKYIIRNLKME